MKSETKKPTKKTVKKEVKEINEIKKVDCTSEENCCNYGLSKKMKLHLIGFAAVAVLIGVCFYKFGIVATVNGTPIYRWSYIEKLQKSDSSVLNEMVQKALIFGEAKNKGIVIDQKIIDDQIATIESQLKEQNMTLDEALKSEKLTKEDIINQIKMQKIAETLASPSAEVTQTQIDEYLKTNKDYLPTGKTKDELQTLARTQLENQAKNASLSTWYNDLESAAKIIYK